MGLNMKTRLALNHNIAEQELLSVKYLLSVEHLLANIFAKISKLLKWRQSKINSRWSRNLPDNNKWLLVGNETVHYALKQNYGNSMHIKISYDWQSLYYFVYIRFKKSSNSSLVFIYSKKCIIFYGKNYSKKFSGMQALGMCLTYVKRYFQPHQWNVVYFRAQITQILLFLGMPILERSSQFNNDTFSKKFSALDVLGIFRYLT